MLKLICPACKSPLTRLGQRYECKNCKKDYPIINGIPSFIKTTDGFYHRYYQTEAGAGWAKGHIGFKNPVLNILLEMRAQISIVGKRQRFFKKIFGKKRNNLILDLGCGGGHELFVKYGEVTGVDLELVPLETAKGVYSTAIHADISALPFPDNTFDYIVSSDVMGHIPIEKKDRLLSEIYRVLKAGGRTAHAIETDSNNLLYRFAHKYPDLFKKSFVEDIGGHFGLEMPDEVLSRFRGHNLKLIMAQKLWGLVWPTEEYVSRFDNAYKEKSLLIRLIVFICGSLNKNIVVHAAANVLMGIVNYFVSALTPLDHAGGILVLYEK